MSTALLRQALEFVDPDESIVNRKKRVGGRVQGSPGQVVKAKNRANKGTKQKRTDCEVPEETVNRLLKLSAPAIDHTIAGKIVERASAGKPVLNEIKINKTEEQKSILFPEEEFQQFEEELFCS